MEQLEIRVYSKPELGEILGIDPKDKNYKRKVETALTNWGYEYEYPAYSKTITITSAPSGEYKLAELLIREYGIDVRINPIEFACFIHAFNYVDGFESMPWGERQKMLYDFYGIEVCERTLRNWANKLFTSGTLAKTEEKTYWRSAKISDTETMREQVEREDFVAFHKYRGEQRKIKIAEMVAAGHTDIDYIRKESWNEAHLATMNKFGGWTYYPCKTILLSAFDENDLKTIFDLVNDIAPIAIELKEQEDAEAAELRAAIQAKVQYDIAHNNISADEFYF